jgi:hypothetical protein
MTCRACRALVPLAPTATRLLLRPAEPQPIHSLT